MTLSFLVLTDHSGHSNQNSFYSLVNTLAADPRCQRVDVASRGDDRNRAFFQGQSAGPQVLGFTVNSELLYEAGGGHFGGAGRPLDMEDYDVIWLRLPHPVPSAFFTSLNRGGQRLIVNDPEGITETGDKSFLTQFPDLTPPLRLVHSAEEVKAFARDHQLVLKPLRAYGGRGIVRLKSPGDRIDLDFKEPYLAMKFLKNVSQGDKRILLVNGKIMAASLRLPAPGGWLCNVAQGGTSIGAEVAPEERTMVDRLAPELLNRGICFAGIDTLVADDGRRVLSEINTLSIGGFPQAEAQTGRPILRQTIDELFNYCYARL